MLTGGPLREHRLERMSMDQLARQQMRRAGPAEDLLRPPLSDRHDRRTGHEREPGDAGSRLHGPPLRILRDRALGIDEDRLAAVQRSDGIAQRRSPLALAAVDRDLIGAAHDPPDDGCPEQALLREIARDPAGLVDEMAQRERVGPGQMVRRDDHSAGAWQPVLALPVPTREHRRQRPDDGYRKAHPRPEPGSGPTGSLGRHSHLASSSAGFSSAWSASAGVRIACVVFNSRSRSVYPAAALSRRARAPD